MNRKKVLYFVEAFGGGVFTYICNLANELCQYYDIYIAYGTRKQTPKNLNKYFNKDIHLIKVKNYQREVSFIKDVAAYKEMQQIMTEVKPDIVHLNSSKSGILGRWLLKNNKAPVFYTPHGYSFLMTNIDKKKKFFYKTLEKIFAFKNVKTIACSKSEYEITKQLTNNATYVDNGINLKEFSGLVIKDNSNLHSNNLKVVTIGRISVQKNPQLFNQIAISFPDIKFIWVGDGDLKTQLTAPNITITGWVNTTTALSYLNEANIFVMTSLWEGLPMALLEAMYMKKICIVSNVVGNKDVIHNEENGYTYNNLNEFIEKVNSLKDNDDLQKIVNCAHDQVVKHYNSKNMALEYKKIYDDALQSK